MARVLRYVTTDAMGSVTSVLSSTGEVLERRSYDAFGKMTCMLPDGTPVAASPTGLKIGFQGQQIDELTGMYQMGYRWYLPVLGRWASSDPIGIKGGVNTVCFVNNLPTDRQDLHGLMSEIFYRKDCEGIESSIKVSTAQDLIDAVGRLPDNSITQIDFGGHSEPGGQGIGDDSRMAERVALDAEGNPILYGTSTKDKIYLLADILRTKMRAQSEIACTGCKVGREENHKYKLLSKAGGKEMTSIPKEISRVLPGVTAIGSTMPTFGLDDWPRNIMLPFTVKKYLNGKEI